MGLLSIATSTPAPSWQRKKREEKKKKREKQPTYIREATPSIPLTKVQEARIKREYDRKLVKEYPTDAYSGVPAYMDSFAQGILPLQQERPGLTDAHPFSNFMGKITKYAIMSGVTGGIAPAAHASLANLVGRGAVMAPGAVNMAAQGAQRAVLWGGAELIDQLARAFGADPTKFKKEEIRPGKVAGETAFGGFSGGLHGIKNPAMRIAMQGIGRGAWVAGEKMFKKHKIDQDDMLDIALNTALGSIVESINAKAVTRMYKRANMGPYLKERTIIRSMNRTGKTRTEAKEVVKLMDTFSQRLNKPAETIVLKSMPKMDTQQSAQWAIKVVDLVQKQGKPMLESLQEAAEFVKSLPVGMSIKDVSGEGEFDFKKETHKEKRIRLSKEKQEAKKKQQEASERAFVPLEDKPLPEKISVDLAGSTKIEELKQKAEVPKSVTQKILREWAEKARAGDEEAWGKIYKYQESNPEKFEKQLRRVVKSAKPEQSVGEILNMIKPVKKLGRQAGAEGAIDMYKGEDAATSLEIDPRTGEVTEYGPAEITAVDYHLGLGKLETPAYNLGYGEEANIYKFDIDNPKTWIKPERLETVGDVDNLLEQISARIPTERLPEVRDKLADVKDKLLEYRDEKMLAEAGIETGKVVEAPKRTGGVRKPDPNFYNYLQKHPISLEEIKERKDIGNKQDLLDSLQGNRGRRVINKKGKVRLDKLAQNAQQDGFITETDIENAGGVLIDAYTEKVTQALSGQKIYTIQEIEKRAEEEIPKNWIQQLKKDPTKFRTERIVAFRDALKEEATRLNAVPAERLSVVLRGAEERLKTLRTFTMAERKALNLPKAVWWDSQIRNLLKPYKEKLKIHQKREAKSGVYVSRKEMMLDTWMKPFVESGRLSQKDFYEAVTRMVERTGNDLNHLEAADEEILIAELAKQLWLAEFRNKIDTAYSGEVGQSLKELDIITTKERVEIRKKSEASAQKKNIKAIKEKGELPLEIKHFYAEGYNINLLDDTRRVFSDLQKASGLPIHHLYEEKLLRPYLLAERERVLWENRFEELEMDKLTPGEWRLLQKVLEGEITEDTLQTKQQRDLIEFFREFYKFFEPRVMYMRVKDYILSGRHTLPKNMPKEIMDQGVNIYLHKGDQALKDWVAEQLEQGDRWGLRKAYSPSAIFNPSILKDFELGMSDMGKSAIRTRNTIEFLDEDTTPEQRFHSYLRQMTALYHLQDGLYMTEEMWSRMAGRFANKRSIEAGLNDVFKTMKGVSEVPTTLESIYIMAARTVYSAVFAQPRLMFRNLLQNHAYYPNQIAYNKWLLNKKARNRTMTEERLEYFNTNIPQDLKKHLFELGKTQVKKGSSLVERWSQYQEIVSSGYSWSDRTNRFNAFGAKLMELDEIKEWTSEVIKEESYFKGSTVQERKHALYLYHHQGLEAYKRYIAERQISNIHWMYDRAQRSPNEQGTKGRMFGAMLTFPKSVLLTTVRGLKNIKRYGFTKTGMKALWATLYSVWIGAEIANQIYGHASGDKKSKPYLFMRIFKHSPGGILLGAAKDTIGNVLSSVFDFAYAETEKDKWAAYNKINQAITSAGDSMIPLWKMVIAGVESYFGGMNMDLMPMKEIRQLLDKDYKYDTDRHKIERKWYEAIQHFFMTTRPAAFRIDKYKEGEKKNIKKRDKLRKRMRNAGYKRNELPPKEYSKFKWYTKRKRK